MHNYLYIYIYVFENNFFINNLSCICYYYKVGYIIKIDKNIIKLNINSSTSFFYCLDVSFTIFQSSSIFSKV